VLRSLCRGGFYLMRIPKNSTATTCLSSLLCKVWVMFAGGVAMKPYAWLNISDEATI
jgi:hypothetical protein